MKRFFVFEEKRGEEKDLNILLSFNKNYIAHAFDCIRSILRFPSKDGYDFYVMHSDLEEQDKKVFSNLVEEKGERIHFIYVDPEQFDMFPENKRYPREIYYRIFAVKYLPPNLERILYLDGDAIVINSLEELYDSDFEGNYFLACTHVKKVMNRINQIRLGAEEVPYINSGVMLMNLKEFRKHIREEDIIGYIQEKREVLFLPDQDIISALYGKKVKLIDAMKYNLSDRMLYLHNSDFRNSKIDLEWIRENAVIIHYYGKQKPWKKPYYGILNVFYDELINDRM